VAQGSDSSSAEAAMLASRADATLSRWHAGWFIVTTIAAIVCWRTASGPAPTVGLAIASLAGAAGAILARRRRARADGWLLFLWAVGAGAAVLAVGGLSGPLAALALAPLAAACALGGLRNLGVGAAFTFVCVAVAALAGAAGLSTSAAPPWLAAFAVTLVGGGFATALALAARRRESMSRASGSVAEESRAILEGQGVVVLDIAADGRVREHFGELFEPLTEESLTAGFALLARQPEILDSARALAKTSGGRIVVGFAPADAPDRWIAATLTPAEGGVFAVLRDATLEHSSQVFLERSAAEAMALSEGKSRFLANMSHELRTPLNAVVGFSDIMRSQMFGPLAERYAEYAELIHESGRHLLELINDILDLSKIEAERYELSLEDFDAREAVSAALRLVRAQADAASLRLRGVLGSDPIPVRADRRAVKQIVLNLLSNALKFTPAGGSVTVGIRAAGKALELVIGDTGIGISPGDLERLGAPYEQAGDAQQRARGSGLGLSLVRALSELHGGEMSIQSTLGAGTIVAVRLPVVTEAPADNDPVPAVDNVIAFNPHR
jgi:cell cycle sensor histidine kinase DivJ